MELTNDLVNSIFPWVHRLQMVSSLLGFWNLSRRWARMDAHNWWTSIGGWDRLEMGFLAMTGMTAMGKTAMGKTQGELKGPPVPLDSHDCCHTKRLQFWGETLGCYPWIVRNGVFCPPFFLWAQKCSTVITHFSESYQVQLQMNQWKPPLEPKRVRVVKQSKKPVPSFLPPRFTKHHIQKNPLNNNNIQKRVQTKKNSNHQKTSTKTSPPKKSKPKKPAKKITWLMAFQQRPSSSGRARPQTAGSQRPRSANVQVQRVSFERDGPFFLGGRNYVYIYKLNKLGYFRLR